MSEYTFQKLGSTVETSVFEYDDDLLIICLDGLWYPCLQKKRDRGTTRKFQLLLFGWAHPVVCAKTSKYRAKVIAESYAQYLAHGSKTNVHADPKMSLLPITYVLQLEKLRNEAAVTDVLEYLHKG